MAKQTPTLKGFRDFLPEEMAIRQKVIDTLRKVFESYGYEPWETPALESAKTLLDKYGEDANKLIFQFEDLKGRKVGLRYDLTVPLARVIASYPNLPLPSKRYQIQPVWRAEKPQAGRFREFLQCDADIVGIKPPVADAEIILLAAKSLEQLGLKKLKILINDRNIIFDILSNTNISRKKFFTIIRTIDKLEKIREKGVIEELNKKGFPKQQVSAILKEIKKARKTKDLNLIFKYLKKSGLSENKITFSPTLARGLDYYTGMVFEIQIDGYAGGSVAGGGRYDTLIGFASEKYIPAVGFSFGVDRLIEAMKQQKLFRDLSKTPTKVLVTTFSPELLDKSIEVADQLRKTKINTELYLDPETKLDKQLKYADRKNIPFVIILGPEEIKKKVITLRDMKAKSQKQLSLKKMLEKWG